MPASKLKAEIARILQDEGYIQGFRSGRGAGRRKPAASRAR
jgi:ribosomal protein S8